MPQHVDIAWRVLAWVLVGIGVVVLLRGLAWDALRLLGARHRSGRRRCPGGWGRALRVVPVWRGCWYDLSGTAADGAGRRVCPECGRSQAAWRLKIPRVRWGVAAVGAVVAAAGAGALYGREVYREGWSAVPTWALVLVPFNERDLIENGQVGGPGWVQRVAEEIDERGPFDGWAGDRWAERVRARCRRDGFRGIDQASREAFERLARTRIEQWPERLSMSDAVALVCDAAGVECRVDTEALPPSIDEIFGTTARAPVSALQALDAIVHAVDGGFGIADWTLRSGVVEFTTTDFAYQEQVRTVIPLPPAATREDLVWVEAHRDYFGLHPAGWRDRWPFEERADQMLGIVLMHVRPDNWTMNGGAYSSIHPVGTGLLIGSSARDALMIERLFAEFEAADGLRSDPPHLPGPWYGAVIPEAAGPSITVVHDLLWLRDWRHTNPHGPPVGDHHEALACLLSDQVNPDQWTENGGDAATAMIVLDRLVVAAPHGTQSQVAAILRAVRATTQTPTTSFRVLPNTTVYPVFTAGSQASSADWMTLLLKMLDQAGSASEPRFTVVGNAVIASGSDDHRAAIESALQRFRERISERP